jgi:creatinine amidohydrolase
MLWHELTWEAVESLGKSLPVVIPLGSIEQHGPHLPLCVDTVQVTAVAERASSRRSGSAAASTTATSPAR